MTTLAFDPFEEFQQYLAGISFEPLLVNHEYSGASKRLHKRVLALLIVEHQFGIELASSTDEIPSSTSPYLHEFRSDLLSSLLIFHIGLYKATLMSARSSLENLLRVIAGVQVLEYRNIKTVFELVELVKQSPLRANSSLFDTSLTTLIGKYSEYCDYVHSTGEEYLSLDRKLGDMPRWVSDSGMKCTDSLVKMLQAAICILLLLKPQTLNHLHYDQKDTVLDALSMSMKSALVKEIS